MTNRSTPDTTPDNVLASPSSGILREAIVNTIAPTPSAETKFALQNSRRKRKRVEATHGEVLTTDQVAERLRLETEERKEKDSKGKGRKKATAEKKSSATTRRSSIAQYEDSESDDEEEDDDEDDNSCVVCHRLWRKYKGSKDDR